MTIDLRSDTVTQPSPAMLNAMFNAKTGDDVFGEDPSVNCLEKMVAGMFNMDAALFCPSGTMTNQIAIKCHTQPGDEVICEKLSHVYIYEGGGIAFNSSSQAVPINGNRGMITADQVKENINPLFDYKARSSLVCVENTTNRGGGACYKFTDFEHIKEVCLQNNLKFHLDGARLWNAMVAKGEIPVQYGNLFDSISVCLSKGLGTPAGSLLLGNAEFIRKARRIRKVLGGGMRQSGYFAAAGIYALENNIERLTEDHRHARQIGEALQKKGFICNLMPVETNILIFEITAPFTAGDFTDQLKRKGILSVPVTASEVRMVTHLDITDQMTEKVISTIEAMQL